MPDGATPIAGTAPGGRTPPTRGTPGQVGAPKSTAGRAATGAVTVYMDDLNYLAARLKADPLAAQFAPKVELAAWMLQARDEEWKSHRRAAQEASMDLTSIGRATGNVVRGAQAATNPEADVPVGPEVRLAAAGGGSGEGAS